jgi:protein-S-isoprenylcysteine O-methyltransferase Ste14
MEDWMERWSLVLFFVVYFGLTFAWRSWHVRREAGINPYVLPASDDAPGYVGRAFRHTLIATGAYVSTQAVWPDADSWLGILPWLDAAPVRAAGWTMLLLSLLWAGVAQAHMGLSWRIGIDTRHATGLVRHGLFAVSRNPIFLAMRVSLLGLVLVRPNGLTLALAIAGELLMQLQVRLEEAFLLQRHGAAYTEYCAATRRWL